MKRPKVLIIRFSSIGDIVLTTPVIRCLKKQLKAEVHYLCKKSYHTVVAANPHLDRIYCIQKDVSEVLPNLKQEQYDYIIDLHNNLRSLVVKLSLRKKNFVFDKINFQKWLMVKFKINRLPNRHIVDRYMDTVQPLGIVSDEAGLDYFVEKEVLNTEWRSRESGVGSQESGVGSRESGVRGRESGEKEDGRSEHDPSVTSQYPPAKTHQPPPTSTFDILNSKFNIRHSKYIAFAIGAAHQTKRLPEEKIVDICKGIDLPILLLGGPSEKEEGARIAKASGTHVINTCGLYSLSDSALVVKNAWKVITHDTGMMHIAAAYHKDIISIWGNTIPEFGMYPYLPRAEGSNTTIQVEGLSCRPCSKIGYQACPKGHFDCMQKIPIGTIIEKLKEKSPD